MLTSFQRDGMNLRLQDSAWSVKMMSNSCVRDEVCAQSTVGTTALAFRGQAAPAEDAALHTALREEGMGIGRTAAWPAWMKWDAVRCLAAWSRPR